MNRKVLLLNSSFEALGMVDVPRAVRLIWKGAAEMVEQDGSRVLRSQHYSWPQPSVIRLIAYIDIRTRQGRTSSKRNRILLRDKFRCQYCGKRGNQFNLTVDHIQPKSKGGKTSPENLVTACKSCNQRKGDRSAEEARMPLLKNPAALTYGIDRAPLIHMARYRPEWKPYLFLTESEESKMAAEA